MPFPITFADASHDTPRALAISVMTQLSAGAPAHDALIELSRTEALSRAEATGLAAALVQTRAPAAVIAGCHLAHHLGDAALAPLLLTAHDALDMGTLLQTAGPDQSIEDLLLSALAACVHDAGQHLDAALTRLRHAGLGRDELLLVLRIGPPDLIRRAVPAIALEGLPPKTADAVAKRLAVADDGARALADGLTGLPASDRAVLLAAITRHNVRRDAPELVAQLFGDTAVP